MPAAARGYSVAPPSTVMVWPVTKVLRSIRARMASAQSWGVATPRRGAVAVRRVRPAS